MGLFSGIKQTKLRNRSEWAGPGTYICRIDRVKVDESRKRETFFAVEMTVLHCTASPSEEDKPHAAGDEITHALWEKHVDTFLSNVKQFVASTLDVNPDEIDEEKVEALVGEDQPLSGMVIEYKGDKIKTKKGHDFTRITYRGEVPVARLRALLSQDVVDNYFEGGALLDEIEETQKAMQA